MIDSFLWSSSALTLSFFFFSSDYFFLKGETSENSRILGRLGVVAQSIIPVTRKVETPQIQGQPGYVVRPCYSTPLQKKERKNEGHGRKVR